MSRSPAAILFDIDGNPVQVGEHGQLKAVFVKDPDQMELLNLILQELRRMNLYLETITDAGIIGELPED